jgi:hypothetical protein
MRALRPREIYTLPTSCSTLIVTKKLQDIDSSRQTLVNMPPKKGGTKRKATEDPHLASLQLDMKKNMVPVAVIQNGMPALERARTIATKKPRLPPRTALEVTAVPAKTTDRTSRLRPLLTTEATAPASRHWLTRPQHINAQNLFVLHCRDNLIPGATGQKTGTSLQRSSTHILMMR